MTDKRKPNTWYSNYIAVDGSGHTRTYCDGFVHVTVLDSPTEKLPKPSLEEKLVDAFRMGGRVKSCNDKKHSERFKK